MKDLFGKAILDYQTGNAPEDLITETSISETDLLEVAYLFRDFDDIPAIEREALALSRGETLDLGCGAGSHALYLQNRRGLNVTAADISPRAIQACRLRGIKHTLVSDALSLSGKYDTILLLMNGAGMCGKLKKLPAFLKKLKSLLNPSGQILLDSSDIIYMFVEDEDDGAEPGEAKWIASPVQPTASVPGGRYYGEVEFKLSYKGETESFDWLYVDLQLLADAANTVGLTCELVAPGEHYDYLARLF
jgi:SAM-dependent methyltransferase